MDDWIINQINRKRLRELLPDLFNEIESGKRITDLPIDVLALVLSYVQLSDVRNCWLVNKQFEKAVKKPHFWKRFIQNHLVKASKIWPDLVKYIRVYNNFNCPIPETLEGQMTFLFRKDIKSWMDVYYSEKGNFLSIDRRSNNKKVFATEIRVKDCLNYSCGQYDSEIPFFNWANGEYINFRNSDNRKTIYVKGELKKLSDVKYASGELIWEGDIIIHNEKYLAHGSGKWTFKDGTIVLEGENVAENGEPVFKLNYEDYKKVKHLL